MDMVRFSNASQLLINHYFTTIHEGNSMIPKQSEKVKSGHTLVPCVLETRVLPMLRTLKTDGALISYQSFLLNGSTLQGKRHRHSRKTGQRQNWKIELLTRPRRPVPARLAGAPAGRAMAGSWLACCGSGRARGGRGEITNVLFLPPFLLLEIRLFLPSHGCCESASRRRWTVGRRRRG